MDPRPPWRRRSLPWRRPRQASLATVALLTTSLLLPPAIATARSVASIDVDPGAAVRLYGAEGTFGSLSGAGATPSGARLDVTTVPGWRFLPGQSAYFPTVAHDGTVIIANEPQTDNQLMPTARQMAVTTFQPATRRFANVVVPTSSGRTELGGPWPDASGIVGGGDVSDVGVVRAGSTTRVLFTSAMPFWGWATGGGEYPTLGVLRPGSQGSWIVDGRRSRTASQLASSASRSARAARRAARHAARHTRRAARAAAASLSDACTRHDYPGMDAFGDCRMPAEFAQLPASQTLVLTQYATDGPARPSGRLTAVEPLRGEIRGSYPYPRVVLADGTPLTVHPREVVADPRGRRGDERFVVIFDAERGLGDAATTPVPGAIQEFSFDAATGEIRPTSAPVLTGDLTVAGVAGMETAAYDDGGDLWVGQSAVGTLQAGPVVVYERRGRGTLGERPGCRAGADWNGERWGRRCDPDARVPVSGDLGIARSLDWNAATNAMLLTTMNGSVLPMHPVATGVTPGPVLDLGLDRLADRTLLRIGPRKAALDARRHTLWIPIQQLATDRTCAVWPCPPQVLDQWLYSVDVSRLG